MKLYMNVFKNKVIIITGATRGIGLSLVKKFLPVGARLALCSRDTSEFQNHFETDENIFIKDCYVSNYEDVRSFINQVYKKFGNIDILINNAAIGVFDKIENISVEDWNRLININLNGCFYMCHDTIPLIKKNTSKPKGYIFNIGSISHNFIVKQNSAYSASKAATKALSDHLYNELRTEDILVTYMAAGSVNTTFSKRNPDTIGWKIRPENIADIVFSTIQTGYNNSQCCTNYLEVKTNSPIQTETFKE